MMGSFSTSCATPLTAGWLSLICDETATAIDVRAVFRDRKATERSETRSEASRRFTSSMRAFLSALRFAPLTRPPFLTFSDTFPPQGVYRPSAKPALLPMQLSVVVITAPRMTLLKVTPERKAMGMASQSRQKTRRQIQMGSRRRTADR